MPKTTQGQGEKMKPDANGWLPIAALTSDGRYLCYWPAMKLDDDGNLTAKHAGHGIKGVAQYMQGQWDEPDALNAVGSSFDDDFEYAGEPTHFQPLPADPVPHV
jgi:hypothetical protein